MSNLEQRLIAAVPLFQKYPSPISVATRMAQFALESQAGASELFKKSNSRGYYYGGYERFGIDRVASGVYAVIKARR